MDIKFIYLVLIILLVKDSLNKTCEEYIPTESKEKGKDVCSDFKVLKNGNKCVKGEGNSCKEVALNIENFVKITSNENYRKLNDHLRDGQSESGKWRPKWNPKWKPKWKPN